VASGEAADERGLQAAFVAYGGELLGLSFRSLSDKDLADAGSRGAPATDAFALSGPHGAHATIVLTPEKWGTAVNLRTADQPYAGVLTVWMREDNGSWWAAGTYHD
jgi:hypothetical protein